MRSFLVSISAALLLGTTGAGTVSAQAAQLSGADLYGLYDLAQRDPATAAPILDRTIAAMQAAPDRDMRSFFDLILLRAEIAEAQGNWPEAARFYIQLAQAAEATPDLDADSADLWARAVTAAEQAQDLRAAREAATQRLSALRDRTPDRETLAQAHDDLARLAAAMGDSAAEQASRAAAEAVRTAQPETGGSKRGEITGYREVDVYYATDRARSGKPAPAKFYGGQRGDGLDLGIARVTVPDLHEPGLLEAPRIWKLEFSANPAKHVVLQSVDPVPADQFFGRLQGEFAGGDKSEAFVFIHGYNVSFQQAARRAAQIAVDMGYPSVPILYSWPSRGRTAAYVADTAVVRLSGRRLSGFLDDLVQKSGAQTIHIIAHSMGNRALTDALELLALKRQVQTGSAPLFGQVLFAAPDVDAGLFTEMIRTIRPLAQRLTLYASEQDWALVSSRKLHGNAPRAGQGGAVTLSSADIDSIDMSELGDDMLAHSYFADDNSALADMAALFWRNAAPERRCGLQQEAGQPEGVWLYRRDACQSTGLLSLMAHLRDAEVETVPQAMSVLSRTTQDPAKLSQLEPVITRLLKD